MKKPDNIKKSDINFDNDPNYQKLVSDIKNIITDTASNIIEQLLKTEEKTRLLKEIKSELINIFAKNLTAKEDKNIPQKRNYTDPEPCSKIFKTPYYDLKFYQPELKKFLLVKFEIDSYKPVLAKTLTKELIDFNKYLAPDANLPAIGVIIYHDFNKKDSKAIFRVAIKSKVTGEYNLLNQDQLNFEDAKNSKDSNDCEDFNDFADLELIKQTYHVSLYQVFTKILFEEWLGED